MSPGIHYNYLIATQLHNKKIKNINKQIVDKSDPKKISLDNTKFQNKNDLCIIL
jgi:hypothetical protein